MSLPAIPPLDDTLGAVEIGGIVTTFLFGIGTLQTHHYFKNYPNDSKYLKWVVALVWLYFNVFNVATLTDKTFESTQVLGAWAYDMRFSSREMVYSLTVTFYCQPQHINHPPHSLQMSILFSGPIYFIVQVFFANRIRNLSGQWTMTIICWALTLTRAVATFGMMGVALHVPQLSDIESRYKWLMATGLSLGVAVDVLVALSLCVCLWRMRSNGVESTRRMIDSLILWTIETGLATGGASVILLVFFFLRDDLTWFPFYLILAKLFSNSMLASLNGRQRLRVTDREILSVSTGSRFARSAAVFTSETKGARATDFEMSTVTDIERGLGNSKGFEAGHRASDEQFSVR
ncbi:O-methylsterigmatocystin oxidoreductase [Mycena sanguinolenta]|uniref:O-methylsterigmatocystin oxidoreductase n=1 Tax=Mycena sanguinolenta TaxID=230812 RepID=A0A8H6Y0I3_9AGAR|nr:O-methylsterigmatocystin oxidoreductase [Mycena sanguinolenta]